MAKLFLSLILLGTLLHVKGQNLPTKGEILADLLKVNNYYMSTFPETETVSTGEPNWLEGSYFNGHLAIFELYPSQQNIQYAMQWAKHNNWNIGNKPHEADNQCVGQAYMDLYYAFGAKDDYMLEKVGTSVQNLVNRSTVNEWDWIDALYMAMPVLTRYGIQNENTKYFDKLYAMYHSTKVSQKLFNASVGLWYRDGKVLSGVKKKCHWSRGNGWVFGAHVRTLRYLPEDDAHREEYIETFKKMASSLIKYQRTDGFWNASITDPSYFPGPETSGTAFFVYGLAWGINNGILDRETYLPAVISGWNGLSTIALTASGRVGYTQGVADEPKDAQPVTINSSRHYGEGNFLLAGTEVIKLAEGELPVPTDFYVEKVEMINASSLKIYFYEAAESSTAMNISNYTISNGVEIESAKLATDGLSCELSLINISEGAHSISFDGIKSVSGKTIGIGNGKYFMANLGTGSSKIQKQNRFQLQVYPNPVKEGYVQIQLANLFSEYVTINLIDLSGKTIRSEKSLILNQTLNHRLNVENLKEGIYLLSIQGNGINQHQKLFIQ